jgi:hypothetical protein
MFAGIKKQNKQSINFSIIIILIKMSKLIKQFMNTFKNNLI